MFLYGPKIRTLFVLFLIFFLHSCNILYSEGEVLIFSIQLKKVGILGCDKIVLLDNFNKNIRSIFFYI